MSKRCKYILDVPMFQDPIIGILLGWTCKCGELVVSHAMRDKRLKENS